jgi:hypothetical protein
MTIPPPGFKDTSPERTQGATSTTTSELPAFIKDLPTPVREKIDAIVQNDEDLTKQMAVIDALLMGTV